MRDHAASPCAAARRAPALVTDERLERLVNDSVFQAETHCTSELSDDCVKHADRVAERLRPSRAGCPFAVRSRASLLHDPNVEACIRMGFWWNRPYCAGALLNGASHPPGVDGVSLVNASGVLLPPPDNAYMRTAWASADRIKTFTARRWPFAIAAAAAPDLAIAINPADSSEPGGHGCTPTLSVVRVAPTARTTAYSRHDPKSGDILWAGVTIGFDSLPPSNGFFHRGNRSHDVPWRAKRNMMVFRGAVNTCWALDGSGCPSRDLARDGNDGHDWPPSHASRIVAWKRLHASKLADFAFSDAPMVFDPNYKGHCTHWQARLKGFPSSCTARTAIPPGCTGADCNPWFRSAEQSVHRFWPQRNVTSELRELFADLHADAQKLCHVKMEDVTLKNGTRVRRQKRPEAEEVQQGQFSALPCKRSARPARMDAATQSGYKIILSIDGASYPSSIGWAQLTSSVVMGPLSAYETYADAGMLPWVHYIPTRLDFSDAEEHAEWCFSHDKECEAIGLAGRTHMRRLFKAGPAGGGLRLSELENRTNELIVAHLVANARRCTEFSVW